MYMRINGINLLQMELMKKKGNGGVVKGMRSLRSDWLREDEDSRERHELKDCLPSATDWLELIGDRNRNRRELCYFT
jgi:hypothetical protein